MGIECSNFIITILTGVHIRLPENNWAYKNKEGNCSVSLSLFLAEEVKLIKINELTTIRGTHMPNSPVLSVKIRTQLL